MIAEILMEGSNGSIGGGGNKGGGGKLRKDGGGRGEVASDGAVLRWASKNADARLTKVTEGLVALAKVLSLCNSFLFSFIIFFLIGHFMARE